MTGLINVSSSEEKAEWLGYITAINYNKFRHSQNTIIHALNNNTAH